MSQPYMLIIGVMTYNRIGDYVICSDEPQI